MLLVLIAAIAGFTSCSSDDDSTPQDDPTPGVVIAGSFTLASVPSNGEMVFVENFTMPKEGWIVVRRDNGHNAPMMSEIISIPESIAAGIYPENSIRLKENVHLKQGERLWVNLHADDGDHIFFFDGSSVGDMPLGIFDVFAGFVLISDSFIVDLQNP